MANICKSGICEEIVKSINFTNGWICKILYEHDGKFKEKLDSSSEKICKVKKAYAEFIQTIPSEK